MTTVEAQWEETLGDNGTGTGQLQAGLDTLSMSAQLVKSTYLADKIPQTSWKLELKRVKAVGLSGMVGPIDFGATELPHGWEEPPAGDDSLTGRTERMQALLRKMVEMQAYSAVGKTPEAMRAEAAAARSEAAEEGTLRSSKAQGHSPADIRKPRPEAAEAVSTSQTGRV